jgi:hypothetical protein
MRDATDLPDAGQADAPSIPVAIDLVSDPPGSDPTELTRPLRAWLADDAAFRGLFVISGADGGITAELPAGAGLAEAAEALFMALFAWARHTDASARLGITRPSGDRLEVSTARIKAMPAPDVPALAAETSAWVIVSERQSPAADQPADEVQEKPAIPAEAGRRWWRKLLTAPGILVAAAATTLVSFAATEVAQRVTAEVRAGDPLDVAVERDPARIPGMTSAGVSAVIPVGAPTKGGLGKEDCDGFHRFVRSNNGVDTGRSQLQVVLQGKVPDAVLVTSMRVVILQRGPALTGIPVLCSTEGEAAIRSVSIDLDSSPPKVAYGGDKSKPFAFTIANGETETFNVTASARKAYYRWVLELDVLVRGDKTTLRVGDEHDPFATSAVASRAHWSSDHGGHWNVTWDGGDPPPGLPPGKLTVPDGDPLSPLP